MNRLWFFDGEGLSAPPFASLARGLGWPVFVYLRDNGPGPAIVRSNRGGVEGHAVQPGALIPCTAS